MKMGISIRWTRCKAREGPVDRGAMLRGPNPASGGSGRRAHMQYTHSKGIEGVPRTHAFVPPRGTSTIPR